MASRARAKASMARLASTPSPDCTRGASNSSRRPVPVPISRTRPEPARRQQRKQRRLHVGRGQPERPHLVPIGALLAEAFGRDARPLGHHARGGAAVGGQHRVVLRDAGEQAVHQLGLRRQAEPDVRPLAHPLEHAGIAEQPEVAGEARLRLAEDLGQFDDAERAAGGKREQAQPGRLGAGAKGGEKGIHRLHMT